MLLAKKSHHSWSQCLFCPDLTTVIHCWPAYHLLLSNLQRVQNAAVHLVVLGLRDHATPGLQQLHWLPVEHRITFKLCMLLHLIYIGRAPRYMVDSVQTIVESSRKPGLRSATLLTTSNIVFNRSLVNAASVTLVRLPGIRYLSASSSSRTLVDLNSFSSLIYFVLLFDILLAPLDNL